MWKKNFLLHGTDFTSLSDLLFVFFWSPLSLCTVFNSISSNKHVVLSINPFANAFVFTDCNFHNKDWPIGTDRSDELCYNLKPPCSYG